MSKGVHRVTPNSKAGRQFYRIGKEVPNTLSPEVKAWNDAVDAKKKAKKRNCGKPGCEGLDCTQYDPTRNILCPKS